MWKACCVEKRRNIVNFKLDRGITYDITHLSQVWDKKKSESPMRIPTSYTPTDC